MGHVYTDTAPLVETQSAYDQGYDAGWDGLYWHQNPYRSGDELVSEDAKAWERGRHDGRRDKRE